MPARPFAQRIDWIDPELLFRAGPGRAPHAFWLDAGPAAATGFSWLGTGTPQASLPDDLTLDVDEDADDGVPGGFVGGWIGWSGYDAAAGRAGAPAGRDDAVPQQAALAVRRFVVFDHAAREAWLIAPECEVADAAAQLARWSADAVAPDAVDGDARDGDAGGNRAAASPTLTATARDTPERYATLIQRCRDAIRAGDAYQLCLTTRFSVEASGTPIDPLAAYLRLRRAQPAHHGGFIRFGDRALLSASPEQFLHVAAGVVRTRPIKGTRPRGVDAAADRMLARELVDSPKERAENVMIVDLMRNDLQRVCRPGTVAAERLLEVESYPAVHQLVSTVAGRLIRGTTLGTLLGAAFPAGSMTGAPKLSAMTLLRALEEHPRGIYAGCFGWVGADGRLDLAMTIRSIVVHAGGAYVGAGGGITWLSDPDAEVAEVAVKARGPLAALGAALPPEWAAAESAGAPVR